MFSARPPYSKVRLISLYSRHSHVPPPSAALHSIAMETSPACVSRLVSSSSSIFFSPFSDQSHLDFYHHRSTSLSLSLRSCPSRSLWKPSASPLLAALCESSCAPPVLAPVSEQNSLMKELAELKLKMKQKKKELKSQKKDEKKRKKLHEKEGKKTMKQKDGIEGNKNKCKSESSSNSESSDDECESTSMGSMLWQERSLLCDSEGLPARAQGEENASRCCEGSRVGDAMCIARDYVEAPSSKGVHFNDETCREIAPAQEDIQRRSVVSSSMCCPVLNSPFTQAPNRIEVCAGGKCKKAGSEQLLLALGAQLPSASNVAAVPCKCMGKCSMAMNVKVHKEDTNPQHHSHVRVEDANLILRHHFGLGRPSSGLPSLSSQDRTMVPLTTSA